MHVLLVGCGKMGGAMLTRWKDLALYTSLCVIEPSKENVPAGVTCVPDAASTPEDFHADVVVNSAVSSNHRKTSSEQFPGFT